MNNHIQRLRVLDKRLSELCENFFGSDGINQKPTTSSPGQSVRSESMDIQYPSMQTDLDNLLWAIEQRLEFLSARL